MTVRLPESFYLPAGKDYDHVIDELDHDIEQEGSVSLYLYKTRKKRRLSAVFDRTLRDQAIFGLSMEAKDETG